MSRLPSAKKERPAGFTLLEVLLAVSIMAAVMSVTFIAFTVVSKAWRRGVALTDQLHHGDFVMEQVVMGLRSAYYPDTRGKSPAYGFVLEDNGDNPEASDVISWVKMGTALLGEEHPLAGSLHRARFQVDDHFEEGWGAVVEATRLAAKPGELDDSEPEQIFLSSRVTGFNCRTAFEMDEDDEIDWLDDWEDTNRVPLFVEITLYLAPLEETGEPVVVKRAFDIPVGPLCWR